MEYTVIADSLFIDSIDRARVFKNSLLESFSPLLDGDVIYKATALSDQANLFTPGNQSGWYFPLLFFLFAAIAISRIVFEGMLSGAFQSAIRFSVAAGMFNDNSLVQRQKDNILYIIYFLSIALFMNIIEIRFSIYPFHISGFMLFLWNIAFLVALFFSRILLLNIVSHIFNQRNLFREYLYHSFSLNKLFGLLFIPLDFLLVYTKDWVQEVCFYTAITFVAIMIGMKIRKGTVFALKKRVFNFYLLLYLCALEIVPILLIYKWIRTIV